MLPWRSERARLPAPEPLRCFKAAPGPNGLLLKRKSQNFQVRFGRFVAPLRNSRPSGQDPDPPVVPVGFGLFCSLTAPPLDLGSAVSAGCRGNAFIPEFTVSSWFCAPPRPRFRPSVRVCAPVWTSSRGAQMFPSRVGDAGFCRRSSAQWPFPSEPMAMARPWRRVPTRAAGTTPEMFSVTLGWNVPDGLGAPGAPPGDSLEGLCRVTVTSSETGLRGWR